MSDDDAKETRVYDDPATECIERMSVGGPREIEIKTASGRRFILMWDRPGTLSRLASVSHRGDVVTDEYDGLADVPEFVLMAAEFLIRLNRRAIDVVNSTHYDDEDNNDHEA